MTAVALLPSPVAFRRAQLFDAIDIGLKHWDLTGFNHFKDAIENERHNLSRYLSISCESPERVSYAQSERHTHDDSKRVSCTLQRYLRRNYSESLAGYTNQQLEHCCSILQSQWLPVDYGFSVVSGDELELVYKVGPRSCMSGGDSYKVRLWARNPEHISLITLTENGKVTGRCLLWLGQYFDRVYCTSSVGRLRFDRYLRDRFQPIPAKLKITLDNDVDNDAYPYADTMRYVERLRTGKIIVRNYNRHSCDGVLNSTCGSYPDSVDCACCGDSCAGGGNGTEDGDVCTSCFEQYYVWIESRDSYVHVDNVCTDIHDEYIRTSDVRCYCDDCDRAIGENDSYDEVYDDNGHCRNVCENCIDDITVIRCPCCDVMVEVD